MTVELTKDSIDLGIVTTDGERSLSFYRDVLGFEHVGDMPVPGGGTMHRLRCGTSLVKLVVPGRTPPAEAPPGGINGATGYRYWTISVSNLDDMVESCRRAGRPVPVGPTEVRPGVRIAMVEDPDGNWVELLSAT